MPNNQKKSNPKQPKNQTPNSIAFLYLYFASTSEEEEIINQLL